jgi:hypothetical protein
MSKDQMRKRQKAIAMLKVGMECAIAKANAMALDRDLPIPVHQLHAEVAIDMRMSGIKFSDHRLFMTDRPVLDKRRVRRQANKALKSGAMFIVTGP